MWNKIISDIKEGILILKKYKEPCNRNKEKIYIGEVLNDKINCIRHGRNADI